MNLSNLTAEQAIEIRRDFLNKAFGALPDSLSEPGFIMGLSPDQQTKTITWVNRLQESMLFRVADLIASSVNRSEIVREIMRSINESRRMTEVLTSVNDVAEGRATEDSESYALSASIAILDASNVVAALVETIFGTPISDPDGEASDVCDCIFCQTRRALEAQMNAEQSGPDMADVAGEGTDEQ